MQRNKLEIRKNIKDLEYKKLLSDYNASLAAIISVSLGSIGISYQISENWIFSLVSGTFVLFTTNFLRKNISQKLKSKLEEIKTLAKEDDLNT